VSNNLGIDFTDLGQSPGQQTSTRHPKRAGVEKPEDLITICSQVNARSSGEKLTVFVNLYDNTDFIRSTSREVGDIHQTIKSNSLDWNTIESVKLTLTL
jgi:hypothetical protein